MSCARLSYFMGVLCLEPLLPTREYEQVMYLVTKQSVVYDCDVKHCITRDNVPVVLRATAVFRVLGDIERGEDPALVRKFVYELGVRGLETQLANAVVSTTLQCSCSSAGTAVATTHATIFFVLFWLRDLSLTRSAATVCYMVKCRPYPRLLIIYFILFLCCPVRSGNF